MNTGISRAGSPVSSPKTGRGFTMIEMLVVFGVIAVLAGLIVAGAGRAAEARRRSRAQAERDAIVSAIESYKAAFGYYPHDNATNITRSALFYELTGTVITLVPGATGLAEPSSYYSPISGETLKVAEVKYLFGVDGFANANSDATQIKNVGKGLQTSGMSWKTVTNGIQSTFLGVNLGGPDSLMALEGRVVTPWNYVSTNPTNNAATFDLWVDVSLGSKVYRISNWSKEPKPL